MLLPFTLWVLYPLTSDLIVANQPTLLCYMYNKGFKKTGCSDPLTSNLQLVTSIRKPPYALGKAGLCDWRLKQPDGLTCTHTPLLHSDQRTSPVPMLLVFRNISRFHITQRSTYINFLLFAFLQPLHQTPEGVSTPAWCHSRLLFLQTWKHKEPKSCYSSFVM